MKPSRPAYQMWLGDAVLHQGLTCLLKLLVSVHKVCCVVLCGCMHLAGLQTLAISWLGTMQAELTLVYRALMLDGGGVQIVVIPSSTMSCSCEP